MVSAPSGKKSPKRLAGISNLLLEIREQLREAFAVTGPSLGFDDAADICQRVCSNIETGPL